MAEFPIPGVYSEIDASAAVQAITPNNAVIGIIGVATSGDINKPYAPTSYDDAVSRYGKDSSVVKLMRTATSNGGNRFIIVRVESNEDGATSDNYALALAELELEEAVNIVITDSTDPIIHLKIKEHCDLASEDRKERIAFVGHATKSEINTVMTAAQTLNSGRVYTSYPNPLDENGEEVSGIFAAAALAGQIAAETDPSMPMTNVGINGFYGLAKKMKESEIVSLIEAGVIPFESINGSITIVRCISTYTKDADGQTDITWQEITTTRISDYIFKDLRTRLRRQFARAKQNQATRDAIRSEVITSLLEYQNLEYLENVNAEEVIISVNPANPLRNDVVFPYDVTGPVNVIHLKGFLKI